MKCHYIMVIFLQIPTIDNPLLAHQTLQWRHNECNGISNHRRLACLLNGLFGHRSKKISKLHVTGLCAGNSPVFVLGIHRGLVNSPHKGPVMQKMFPFDDVIMRVRYRLSVESPIYHVCSITVTALLYGLSCYIGWHYLKWPLTVYFS